MGMMVEEDKRNMITKTELILNNFFGGCICHFNNVRVSIH